MLSKLTIDNYALINHLELDFGSGFTIITGETGAGKSILLGALGLLRGGRADTRVVADKTGKSIVEAKFLSDSNEIRSFFEREALDWNEDGIIVRREISATGRSRAFINDTPVNLTQIAELTDSLIDIHSQHENRMLGDTQRQLDIIDVFSENSELRTQYAGAFQKAVKLRNRIKSLKRDFENIKARKEMIEYQYNILRELNPVKGELPEIEKRHELATQADELKSSLGEFIDALSGDETGALDLLYSARAHAEKGGLDKLGNNFAQRLESLTVELRDIVAAAEDSLEGMDIDSEMIGKLSERMNLYYDAMRQFRVTDPDRLVEIKNELAEELGLISGDDNSILKLEAEAREANKELKRLGDELSASRRAGAGAFAEMVERKAIPMGLANLKFEVELTQGKFTNTGQDIVTFMAAFNKNREMNRIDKVASGGEMSRLMLAIKSVLAGRMNLPTIIFDEVDTGVSGEVADKMGDMMLEMSERMQVISITHLPQVAAKGVAHFKVYKNDEEGRTHTHVSRLSEDMRVREIAAMMSGKDVSEAALQNARNLLHGGLS